MGKLINIDNGGTLTDICVIDGGRVVRTKTLTTPYDLSKCFLDGLKKAATAIYGKDDVLGLLLSTDHIRYSTTQGTNALVERKGQRLGVILTGSLTADQLRRAMNASELFDVLVAERSATLDLSIAGEDFEMAAVRAVNALSSAGANRLVVAHGGADRRSYESRVKSILLQKFPPHLLGAIPILYSHEVVEDENDIRRTWTALFNAFLHPTMERFLYTAEHKLRSSKIRSPLLIFRNDGHSARVAKTIAIKTYSSGPRGGMEGARAVAAHYGFAHLISMDVGGTTTDIGEVKNGDVRVDRRGKVENVEISFPLCNVVSVGIGGSSIVKPGKDGIRVGPESVGSTPGPACFGLGGKEATITDALLLSGLLDPATFFGGELKLDRDRARAAIKANVAEPLGIGVEGALASMEEAWVRKIADNLKAFIQITPETTLAAFGGAGPLVVCRVAEAAGISRVLIPGLAAVFSAFGLGFSDIQHQYEAPLAKADAKSLESALAELHDRAKRGMFAEGFKLEECELETSLQISHDGADDVKPLVNGTLPNGIPSGARLSVVLSAKKGIPRPALQGRFGALAGEAVSRSVRRVLDGSQWSELAVYRVEDQKAGASASGPAVLEEAYFTCRIDPRWHFEINDSGDILLSRG